MHAHHAPAESKREIAEESVQLLWDRLRFAKCFTIAARQVSASSLCSASSMQRKKRKTNNRIVRAHMLSMDVRRRVQWYAIEIEYIYFFFSGAGAGGAVAAVALQNFLFNCVSNLLSTSKPAHTHTHITQSHGQTILIALVYRSDPQPIERREAGW